MKKLLLAFTTSLAVLTSPLGASPLQRSQVSSDAKWLLHLDVDAFRESRLGSFLLKVALKEAGPGLQQGLNIDPKAVVEQTASLTVYGMDFDPRESGAGVVILKGSPTLEQVVTGLLVQQGKAAEAGEGMARIVREGSEPVYQVADKMLVRVRPGRAILMTPVSGNSSGMRLMEIASKAMDDREESLESSPLFGDYAALPGGFMFLALAEGFAAHAGLPPQAQVLKLAEGGRIALSEESDNFRIQLDLKAATEEGAVQIQQVLQGLVALASLAQTPDPELARMQEWAKKAKVASQQKMVSFDMAIPVQAALEQFHRRTGHGDAPAPKSELHTDPAAPPAPDAKPAAVRP